VREREKKKRGRERENYPFVSCPLIGEKIRNGFGRQPVAVQTRWRTVGFYFSCWWDFVVLFHYFVKKSEFQSFN
jgi:hypothetical protein